ncbi:hypothetical protein N7462_007840 [Penicillium macrosclerotiorum]|uniref:uncharacterized protein n=1 Tax=Penicillium macrosclerotiorum TaxID=303699 RepID=UPI002549BDD6|nr:uncharacterized protein N7462_007840 [Penicillium macrosclerotiorum]KAJ5679596.1 hypothetical protein N7462_007840 [Penicillium macrosclerotiorum]
MARHPDGSAPSEAGVPHTPAERERFAKTVLLRRMGDVNVIAHAAVYTASDETSFVIGINVPTGNGRLTM